MCLAVPGRIVAIAAGQNAAGMAAVERPAPDSPADSDLWRMATVDFGGVRQPVSLACLPEARLGDLVLVHVGLAICRVEESLLELMEEPIAESMAPRLLETRPDQPEAATLGSTATRLTPRPRPPAVAASDHGVGQGRPEGGESMSLDAASPDPLSQPSPLARTVPVRADRWEHQP
jgi:hydrogenase expression/formation protein HypC